MFGGGGVKAGEEGLADQAHLFNDAACPRHGHLALDGVFAAEFVAHQQDKFDQVGGGLAQDVERDGIAGLGQLVDGRGKRGEVRTGSAVAQGGQVIQVGRSPYLADLLQNAGGLLVIVSAQGAAQAVQADPVARALVAEARAPAACALALAVGRAADGVGAGSGDLENSRPAAESSIERDHFVTDDVGQLDAKIVEDLSNPFRSSGHADAGHSAAGGAART